MGHEAGGEWLTMTEAAVLLGVHRNTVRNRCKAGRYRTRIVATAQGQEYLVERAALGGEPPGDVRPRAHQGAQGAQGAQSPPHTGGAPEPIEAAYHVADANPPVALVPLAAVAAQLQGLADRLADMALEVGQLRERTATQETTIAALRRRAEVAEAERDALRVQASPQPLSAAPTPSAHDDPPVAPGGVQGFWQRMRRVFGGE